MIAVNNKIKNAYNQYTTQRKSKIRFGNNEYFIQNMDLYADAYDEGNIVGNTIAKTLKFDIETQYVRGLDEFELLDGIWTGEEYEYVNLGTFKLFEEQGTDDFFSSITAYDKLILFNEVYNPIQTMYPTTIYGLLQNICEQAGVTLGTQSIANGDKILNGNVFVEGETLKDVLKAICQISGNFAVISNDTLKLKLQGEDNIVLSKYQLSKPEYKRTTWKVNQVVLGMQDIIGEYVLKQDDEDVELNGVHKIVINNNPFVYNQDLRQSYIDELFDALKGFGYVAFETNFEGLPYIELGDSLTIDGYESLVLRYELKSPDGLNSMLQAPSIIDSVIDYVNNTDDIDNKQRRTEYRVNKAEGTITQLTQVTTDIRNDINNNYYTITQTNELVQNASTGITNTFSEAGGNNIFRNTGLWFANNQTDEKEVTSENGKIEVEDAINRDANETKVYGKTEQNKSVSGIGNLFDINSTPFISRVAYNSSGVQQNWDNYSGTTTKTPIQSSTTYTITEDKNTYTTYIVEYNNSETFIQRTVLSNYNKTFTTSSNTKYINISVSSEIVPTKVQIEEGTTSHTPVPYGHWLPIKVANSNDTSAEDYQEQTTLIDFNIYDENNNIIGNYELCSSGDDKDLLTIKDGRATIDKNTETPTETIMLRGEYNINLYEGVNHITIEDDDLIPIFDIKYYTRFMVYDFWEGEVERIREDKSSNRNAMSLQNGILYQDELVPNGNYTISFKYKKLISLATAKVIINNTEYELTETEDTEFEQNFAVNSQNIRVEFVCDVNDGCEVYDLMVNAGSVKLAYSQNQNETTTSTVNISKGITITSSDLDVKFKADADGIRTLDSNNTELTKFTDKGMTTEEAIIKSKSQIVGTLWQQVGEQTWITRM